MKATVLAQVDTGLPNELATAKGPRFDGAWLWIVLAIAGVFIGYLCIDAIIVRRRQKHMDAWRTRRKQK